jgi:hypothetical protein
MKFVADFLTSLLDVFSVVQRMRRTLRIRTDFVRTRMASANLASAYELLIPIVRREIPTDEDSTSQPAEPTQKERRVRR